jgi:nucleoside-diphosphate-sugar epimerase
MITILGAGGFIGSHIIKLLQNDNAAFYAPARNEELGDRDLGDIIYCIGLTADFRSKPFETVEAHVCKLAHIFQKCTFNSLTYLSSARVYINCAAAEVNEDAIIPVNPLDPDELYTLTKLTGERICLSSGKKVKIVRLSNVYGNDGGSENFLTDVITKILRDKAVSFNVLPSSAKDYIHINDVASLLVQIATIGQSVIYNVASGFNTSNAEIIAALTKQLQFDVDLSAAGKAVIFPLINIEKIKQEFNYTPGNITTFIPNLINSYHNVSN